MKNPYKRCEVVDCGDEGYDLVLRWKVGTQQQGANVRMARQAAEYAAYAINRYEGMVAMLRDCEYAVRDDADFERCPHCWGSREEGHSVDCELAALLVEEGKP